MVAGFAPGDRRAGANSRAPRSAGLAGEGQDVAQYLLRSEGSPRRVDFRFERTMEATLSSTTAHAEKAGNNVRRFCADSVIAHKPAFLQWLSIVLAMGIAVFFAAYFGLVSRIWRDDSSHMSSVVAALVVGTAAYIGWLCWRIPDAEVGSGRLDKVSEIEDAAEWGGIAADLCPAIGLAGTIYGLAQQAAALREGGDVLALLGTALFSTLCGVTGFAIVLVLSHILSSSLRRARRNA
jgi:hypothetical protein